MLDVLLIFLCYLINDAFASYCYPDFCQNQTVLHRVPGVSCLLTPVQRGEDCVKLTFENVERTSSVQKSLGKFKLSAYVNDFGEFRGIATAFNLSVTDIHFRKLIMRYQNIGNKQLSVCRYIELYENITHPAPQNLYVSCPFANESFEVTSYRLEYLAIGPNYNDSKKLVFKVPHHRSIDENMTNVKLYTPFIYVAVLDTDSLSLYIQPVPEKFNVSSYKVWLINNDTSSVTSTHLVGSTGKEQHIQHNFTVDYGVYYFKVAAVHSNCDECGCANSTSPFIKINQSTHRLVIMIVSIVWIPPVISYAIYRGFKLYKKRKLLKRIERKPNCLLVYSPTHVAHVNVMASLAKYLRSCNVNAMIDMLDIPETISKDPGLWCNAAFRSADVVVVAASPPSSNIVVPVIYRNMDNHALRLLKENYSRRNKGYLAIQFPYSTLDDIPQEARLFKRFNMPEELDKLVKAIHSSEYNHVLGVSNKDLLDNIKVAKFDIIHDESNKPKTAEETEDLLPPVIKKKVINLEQSQVSDTNIIDMTVNNVSPKYFTTNIDELNLLGENGESEGENLVYIPPIDDSEFCIDKLNL